MNALARKFESLIENFLRTNLEGHTKLLSWTVLALLAACIAASAVFSRYELRLKDSDGSERRMPVIELLLGSDSGAK